MNWLSNITSSEYLYIIIYVVFYLAYAVRMYFISRKIKISTIRLTLKFILRTGYFSLFITALLGPSFGDIKKEIKTIGKDIYIAIDLSASMDAVDINPSRLEKTKFELTKALKNFNSDRIGLLMFTEEAFVQCPLTYDHNAVKLFLGTLNTKMISLSGTDLNAPLSLAYNKFLQPTEVSRTTENAKILILVTDGEDFSNHPPNNWLKKIKAEGIHLIVLGVGSEQGGKIISEKGVKKDREGQPILSALNSKNLKKMSELSGGSYFELTPETNEMAALIKKVSKIEGVLKGSRKIDSAANKYFYFLFAGIVLLILDILISVKTIRI